MTTGARSSQGWIIPYQAFEVSVTKALAAAAAYAVEDVLSESATAGTSWSFANVVPVNGGSGTIVRAIVSCETTSVVPGITLYLFTAVPTSALNDNVANTAVLHADHADYVGIITFPQMADLGGDSSAIVTTSLTTGNLPLPFICATGARGLFGIAVTRSVFTATAGDDLIIKLFIHQD